MSEVWAVLGWWIIIQAFGLAAWPLAFRLLRWLPDRGYMLAKPLGLLLTSYFFWLAVSFRILPNTSIGPLAVKSYAAVQWLDQNISGAPIVLQGMREEAQYQSSLARISSWSGLPTLLGWPSHEVQWRGSSDVLQQRLADIETIYATTDPAAALALLHQYNVQYVYVGGVERKQYPAEGLAKFDRLMPAVFRQDDVTIYRVPATVTP